MRKRNLCQLIVVQILVLSIVLSACSTSKKAALDCPPIASNKTNKLSGNHKKSNTKFIFANQTNKPTKQSFRAPKKKQSNNLEIVYVSAVPEEDNVSEVESIKYPNNEEYSKGLIASTDKILILLEETVIVTPSDEVDWGVEQVPCDTIVLKTGATLIGKVEEIGQTEIKYRKCNNLDGPIISIAKTDVTAIFYSNGSHDLIVTQNPTQPVNPAATPQNQEVMMTEGFAIGGLVAGILAFFVLPLLFGATAIVFGLISLNRIKKNPTKYKGRGLAIASIIVGIAAIVAAIVLTAVLI